MTLDEYLTDKRMTDTAFARLVKISQPHVHRLRSHAGWPGKELAARIKKATGGMVTADDFLRPRPAKRRRERAEARV